MLIGRLERLGRRYGRIEKPAIERYNVVAVAQKYNVAEGRKALAQRDHWAVQPVLAVARRGRCTSGSQRSQYRINNGRAKALTQNSTALHHGMHPPPRLHTK
jgi:hypothetical protein